MSSLTACYRQSKKVVAREVAGEHLLVPLFGSSEEVRAFYVLSEIGSYIWQALDGKRTLEAVRDMLVQEYEVDTATAEKDLLELIDQLVEVKAVEECTT